MHMEHIINELNLLWYCRGSSLTNDNFQTPLGHLSSRSGYFRYFMADRARKCVFLFLKFNNLFIAYANYKKSTQRARTSTKQLISQHIVTDTNSIVYIAVKGYII